MTLYTQPGCSQCKMIHTLLDSVHAKYDECQDQEIMRNKGIDHTPILELADGRLLKGKEIFNYINEVR